MENNILNLEGYKKIAVMGGTFNPIHYGHLVAAEAVRQEFGIEKVLFIPTGKPPHKKNSSIAHNEHRYLMTVLATVNNPYFDVSRIEIDRPGTTYTIDTIMELKRLCSEDTELFFITGADAIGQIFTWKESDKLFDICKFIAVTRPGYNKDNLKSHVKNIENRVGKNLYFLEVPALSISSTDIRKKVFYNKTIKYLLPESVERYILKFGLYSGKDEYGVSIKEAAKKLKKTLKSERFKHTMGVAQEAARLAKAYNEDEQKAYLAGLLHDAAKDYDTELKFELCNKYGLEILDIYRKQPDLLHSFLGAEVIQDEYGVFDEDIINAVRYHTTGRRKMSTLEKIVYLADIFEPNRKGFDGMEEIKRAAFESLNKAMVLSLQRTMEFVKSKNKSIHELSVNAFEYYKNL